jgi:hypothetical protein
MNSHTLRSPGPACRSIEIALISSAPAPDSWPTLDRFSFSTLPRSHRGGQPLDRLRSPHAGRVGLSFGNHAFDVILRDS